MIFSIKFDFQGILEGLNHSIELLDSFKTKFLTRIYNILCFLMNNLGYMHEVWV